MLAGCYFRALDSLTSLTKPVPLSTPYSQAPHITESLMSPYVPPQGVIMSITITTIAACETAIGLALCVTYFHIRSATDVEALNLLK